MKSSFAFRPLALNLLLQLVIVAGVTQADEGMFPVSEIARMKLTTLGLTMDPADIFNAERACLVDGICRVNGCTGSFVSPQGLILTNHHCAYAAIQKASTKDHDYLANGFVARNLADEIPAPGYNVRITESFEDVSSRVLNVVTPTMSFLERTKAIEKQQRALEKEAETNHPGMRAEVAEMFVGERYVLFLYTFIKDVRLVFAPPSSVGNFGGEVDNWEWPRHTGDFSFMRAYVGRDGSSADYSPDNVPYKPKRVIKVQPQGVNENDFVMLLGYPGRTVRHNTASFLQYEQAVRLPFVVELYGWQIATMEAAGENDRAVALKLASRIKSLANVEKRSRGQLQGLHQLKFAARRKAEEERLQSFIESDPQRRARAGNLLSEIDSVYKEMAAQGQLELTLKNLTAASQAMSLAFSIVDSVHERKKPDLEREKIYGDKVFNQTSKTFFLQQNDLHLPVDELMLAEMLRRLAALNAHQDINAFSPILQSPESIEAFAKSSVAATKLGDAEFLKTCLSLSPIALQKVDDPFVKLMVELYPTYLQLREKDKDREGRLSRLYGELFNVKREFSLAGQGSTGVLVPDANGTLRLTYGRVEGYSPVDAVYKAPITSLTGMLAKSTGMEPFNSPHKITELYAARDFGSYRFKDKNDVPVAILYSTDTTGGNSGSPVLNAGGELVGLNFDRTFEATINDFAWDHSYSRSIGVDIRYVLWITEKVYGANHLIAEMGIH